jgi:hypothetical protein
MKKLLLLVLMSACNKNIPTYKEKEWVIEFKRCDRWNRCSIKTNLGNTGKAYAPYLEMTVCSKINHPDLGDIYFKCELL